MEPDRPTKSPPDRERRAPTFPQGRASLSLSSVQRVELGLGFLGDLGGRHTQPLGNLHDGQEGRRVLPRLVAAVLRPVDASREGSIFLAEALSFPERTQDVTNHAIFRFGRVGRHPALNLRGNRR